MKRKQILRTTLCVLECGRYCAALDFFQSRGVPKYAFAEAQK